MIQFCFPTVYWHFSIGQIDVDNLENKCLINTECDCKVKTSRGVEYNWNEFLQTIQPYFLQLPYKKQG